MYLCLKSPKVMGDSSAMVNNTRDPNPGRSAGKMYQAPFPSLTPHSSFRSLLSPPFLNQRHLHKVRSNEKENKLFRFPILPKK